ncbi:transmembrane channel-like protein 7 [Gigantopelta aegis]|uniref:transmembrane channel-like protein 7 n=1 Tax=Gigantopelta aegis TaxID=1735272 RepID=UPI001B88CC56|nr:transmembrane channel-like protein 7 [Gigantopelta aegis]XP_041364902.1 transmembrane channel-like protein 7 [Gigantopelta aegis]
MSRDAAYRVDHLQQGGPGRGEEIPLYQIQSDYEDPPEPVPARLHRRYTSEAGSNYPPHQAGNMDRRRSWGTMDDIAITAELLESLPSRQLESLTSGKHTLRHRHMRHKSYHGSTRGPHVVDQTDAIAMAFDEPDMADRTEEEIGTLLRDMTTTLSSKREIKRRISSKKRSPGRLRRWKYSRAMAWQHFKYSMAEMMYSIELWKSDLKKIEGHFGTSVLSYFLFLKWLFLINIPIFLVTFGFVVLPRVLQRWFEDTPAGYPNASFTGVELLTGAGWFENTEMYYGFYSDYNINFVGGTEYQMRFAYLFTCGAYYLFSLFILAFSILRSYRKYYIEGSSNFNLYYVNKVFCGWDYGIENHEAAHLKHLSIYNELKEYLSGQSKSSEKTLSQKCTVFWIRVVTNVLVLGMICGAGYLVYYISVTQSLKSEIPVLSLLAMPLCIIGINLFLPFVFSLLEWFERYDKPKNELYMHMFRTMLLRAVGLAVLVNFWFNKIEKDKCWETFMGEEIYRLVIVDFIFTLVVTFTFEFLRRVMSRYCCTKIKPPVFAIGRNTLDLIYSQALCWLGTFYSPLLSCIMIVKLIIIFYVKRISVLQNCKPSMRPWRAARSHTIFLGFLMVFFLLTAAAVTCGIIFIHPSTTCGPYRNVTTTYQVVIILIDDWQDEHKWLTDIIHFISSPGAIFGLLVFLCMATYYMRIAMIGHKEMVQLLRQQLSLEGKDKNFLLGLLQEANRKSKRKASVKNRLQTPDKTTETNSFISPGGREFIRTVAESASRTAHS